MALAIVTWFAIVRPILSATLTDNDVVLLVLAFFYGMATYFYGVPLVTEAGNWIRERKENNS